jgi:hypothetical protein
MNRLTVLLVLAVLALGATAGTTSAAHKTATLCVSHGPGCYHSLQAAFDAAHDGDTVKIYPGTYAGGAAIAKSIAVVGSGAERTIVSGGGPVLTIGDPNAANNQTLNVSVDGLTIRDGHNTTKPDEVVSRGGGVWIPENPDQTTGATVRMADDVVTHNSVAPGGSFSDPNLCGDTIPCAFGSGGGIANSGRLTLVNSRVVDNRAGAPDTLASELSSGGIQNRRIGTLVMSHDVVSGNSASGGPPNARQADGGGISSGGALTMDHSVISNNDANVQQPFAGDFDNGAFGGGIIVEGDSTITDSVIDANRAVSTSTFGDTGTFAGGILVGDGTLTLARSSVSGNQTVVSASGSAFSDGGGMEVDGAALITDVVIGHNSVISTGQGDLAVASGGGLANVGRSTLVRTLVYGNSTSANGHDGVSQGGGIWNSTFDDSAPAPVLTLTESAVVRNVAAAKGGITPQGGGIYTTAPVVLTRTIVAANQPDQCFGC